MNRSANFYYPDVAALAEAMNGYGKARTPFFCLVSAFAEYGYLFPLNGKAFCPVLFSFRELGREPLRVSPIRPSVLSKKLVTFERYLSAFNSVQSEQYQGCSYLLNLTFPTEITCDSTLSDIYYNATSPYRILFPDKFVCFSPETFVRIYNNRIMTCPMKGTIDASNSYSVDDAEVKILNDPKESAEHLTIVDLLRNDLSRVAEGVGVDRYRYVDHIQAASRELLQVSSQISGTLQDDWHEKIGTLLFELLPAGSVTGAPKRKTVEIIKQVEGYDRGFYTGIAGFYNGQSFDSTVLIRFVEQKAEGFIYKSGGGITVYSDAAKEYRELVEKIYLN
ncbi:MAG: aminodeoxychorismate synthase component I [Spirochaetes bacterium]|jgi:para-aminobenzoate synthetase component 1|nr:aminodeoxychorismate synthase component I [Spirochaetota bacterium]